MGISKLVGAFSAKRWFKAAAAALCLAFFAAPAFPASSSNLDLHVNFRGFLMITDLTASTGPATGDVTLRWTAPRYTGSALPLSYDIRIATSANINDGAALLAAAPLATYSTSTIPSVLAEGSTQSMVITG